MKSLHPVLRGGPLLIAHRGGAGLAPENTLAAFLRAAELWRADMIELDVRASADGHCVVIHDPTLERTTNGRGPVAEKTLAELQALDAGYRFTADNGRTYPFRGVGVRIPAIDEVLNALPDMRITIEVKTAAAQQPLFAAIERAGAQDRVIAAGERRMFRTQFGSFAGCISAAREDALNFYILHRLRLAFLARLRTQVVQACEFLGERRVLTPRLVGDLHKRGISVHVWTINEVEDMHRLLDWDVDGILTDRPDLLARVLHERLGRPLPPGLADSAKRVWS
ncbi:MAG: glycerophosphodiester phosphodiesterase [Longimicrobiales bacterium]